MPLIYFSFIFWMFRLCLLHAKLCYAERKSLSGRFLAWPNIGPPASKHDPPKVLPKRLFWGQESSRRSQRSKEIPLGGPRDTPRDPRRAPGGPRGGPGPPKVSITELSARIQNGAQNCDLLGSSWKSENRAPAAAGTLLRPSGETPKPFKKRLYFWRPSRNRLF